MNTKSVVKRILAMALSFVLVLTTMPVTALTAYAQGSGACAHVVHDGTCGYAEGADCDHAHDESCGEDGVDCAHDCNDGTCAYIAAAPCKHEHDENCGGLALGDSGGAVIIAGFDPLAGAIARQNFSVGGATLADVNLPDALTATDAAGGSLTIPGVTWQSAPEYEPNTAGTYIFTAALPQGYSLAGGVDAPKITVEVTEATGHSVTFDIPLNEFDETWFFLTEGVPVTDAILLAGVRAADENGGSVDVTVRDVDGLDMDNPVPGSATYPNLPYEITYEAQHPISGDVYTATRDCYVTAAEISPTAVSGTMSVGGTTVNDLGSDASGAGWSWTASSNTLTLDGYNGGKIEINCGSGDEINLVYSGDVTVTNSSVGIRCNNGSLVISGSGGELTIKGETSGIYAENGDVKINSGTVTINAGEGAGIFAYNDVTISDGTVDITSVYGSGIIAVNGKVAINGGTVDITSAYDGIRAENGDVLISGGSVTITDGYNGIYSDAAVSIRGGTIDITAKVNGIFGSRSVAIEDGEITITATGTNGVGIYAEASVIISGGSVDIAASYDGIYGSASVLISGGSVTIDSDIDGIYSIGAVRIMGGTIDITAADNGIFGSVSVAISGGSGTIKSTGTGGGNYSVVSNVTLTAGGVTVKGWDGSAYTVASAIGIVGNNTFVDATNPTTPLTNIKFWASANPVCEIGPTGEKYDNLADALADVQTGQTIRLLKNINYNTGILIENITVTFDVNGYTLNVVCDSGNALEVDGGELILDDIEGGAFNVTSTFASGTGVYASNGANVSVTNATGDEGDVVFASGGAKVTVKGDVSASGDGSNGVYAEGAVTIVTVLGSVTASGKDSYGVYADGGANVTLYGDVTASGTTSAGVYAHDGAGVTAEGHVTAEGTYSCGVHADDYGGITVFGDVTVGGTDSVGVRATNNSTVTIDGFIKQLDNSGRYIQLSTSTTDDGINNKVDPSTKPGYLEYKDGTSTVWVSDKPLVEFAAKNSVNLQSPTNLVFQANTLSLSRAADPLAGYTFTGVRFKNLTAHTNFGRTLGTADGVTYANGLLTIPAALFAQHNSGNPLTAGNYRAEIMFSDGASLYFNYYCDFVLTDNTPTYSLTVQNGTGDGSYAAGAQVTITADAAPSGKVFDGWTGGNGGTFDNASSATTTFTMPGNPATVTATYRDSGGAATYSLTVQNGTGGGNYAAGAQVTITADAAPSGKVFDGWTGGNGGTFDNASSATTIFTMPGNPATVTATYKNIGGGSHTITATAGTGGGISPSGAVSVNDGGSQIFTISPNTNYAIRDVTVDGTSVGAVGSYTFNNVTADHTIHATFNYIGGNGGNGGSGGGSSGSGSGGGSGGGGSSYTPTTPAPSGTTWLEPNPAGTLANNAQGGAAGTKSTGQYGVRANAWAKLAGQKYQHDTMDGNNVQVRLYIDKPGKFTKDAMVSGWVKGSEVDKVRGIFEKWFSNKVRVIHFDQQTDWEQPVGVAARVDLAGMGTENLYFYAYDKKTNSYRRIEKPAYWIDKNGYLHFDTPYAGDIIISENPLERK